MELAEKQRKAYSKGKLAEEKFARLVGAEPCSREDDIYRHKDLKFEVSFDVKEQKHAEQYVWVEICNVQGKTGWLYGEADFIVFKVLEEFIIVDRLKLVEFVEANTVKEYVSKNEAFYKLYQRAGRQDVITKIHTEVIRGLAV